MSSPPSAIRQVARATGTVMVAQVLGHLTNLVSLSLNANAFGTGGDIAAFLAANRISETLFVLMAGGALGSAFIPTFTSLLTKGEKGTAWKLASAVANLVLVTLILVALGGTILHNYTTNTRKDELLLEAEKRASYIDAIASRMEKKATELALNGETFYSLRKVHPHYDHPRIVADFLVRSFTAFPDAIGGGIWYEPYLFDKKRKYFGPYAYWKGGNVEFTWDLSTPEYNYFAWPWYIKALPTEWERSNHRPQEYYWSDPYRDGAGSGALMVTVDAFMYDHATGNIIGMTTVDWSLENMLTLLEAEKITPASHSFLLDHDSGLILSITLEPSMQMHHRSEVPCWRRCNPRHPTTPPPRRDVSMTPTTRCFWQPHTSAPSALPAKPTTVDCEP